MKKLITGQYYWYCNKIGLQWRVCRVAQDPNKNQFLYRMSLPILKVDQIKLEDYLWRKIKKPGNN